MVFFGPAIGFLDQTICPDESFTFGGEVFDQSNTNGSIMLPGASINGCDSTVIVNVDFFPVNTGNLSPVICPGDEFLFGGETFDENNPSGQVTLSDAASPKSIAARYNSENSPEQELIKAGMN